jgi:hypothetical protein
VRSGIASAIGGIAIGILIGMLLCLSARVPCDVLCINEWMEEDGDDNRDRGRD